VVARRADSGKRRAGSRSWLDDAPRLFRRGAIAIVFVCLAYLVAVGFATVPPQVLAPERSTEPVEDCSSEIRTLRSRLLTRSTEVFAGAARGGGDFWREWDLRFAALEGECTSDGHANALVALGRLRYRIESDLDRFEQNDLPLVREIDRELARTEDSEGSR
jgi:hypothetical protein